MAEPVADMEQRRRALDPAHSFIVRAPAGSGKTELLIRRYLRLLALVDEPEEIIAITFTRKAAAEMETRVLNALRRVDASADDGGNAGSDAADAADEAGRLARRALARDRERGWQLLQTPARFRIQTIDALCGHLTRHMPLLARFGAQPQTMEDARPLYRRAADSTIAELDGEQPWADAIATVLMHLDNDIPRLRDMIADMLSRRDQWLRHVLDLPRAHLEQALHHLVESTLTAARAAVPLEMHEELAQLLDYAAANLEASGVDSPLRACRGLRAPPAPAVDRLDTWQTIAELLLTRAGAFRKQANANMGFPPAGGAGAAAERRKRMKDRFADLLAHVSERESLQRRLLEIRRLPPPAYGDAEWQVVEALCRVLVFADAQLRSLFAEHNQMDFSGINRAATTALGSEDAPTDLALHLDYRMRHILVDEFQDISVNQYELLRGLTAGWAPGDGHTLFLVGDPMQSIYRFREAEVGLFLEVWERRRLGQVPLVPVRITVNFRSCRGLVNWVNRAFADILPDAPDADRGAVPFAGAQAFHGPGPDDPIVVHPMIGADDAAEAREVIAAIRAEQRRDPAAGIAILVRSRTHLHDIVRELNAAGLAFRAVEIEALGHRPAIQDLVALTRALLRFSDRIAWLALLRAPWCGLELADLHRLAGDDEPRSIWDCMHDKGRLAQLGSAARTRLERLRRELAPALEHRGRRRLHRWVESAWIAIGGPATLQAPVDLDNARAFFDMLDGFDIGGDLEDLDRFNDALASLFAAADTRAGDGLQIMTIHKAKGLEFETVFLPGLGRGGRADDPRLLMWMERAGGEAGPELLLAPIHESGAGESPIYSCLRHLEKEKRRYEDGRLLYVAVTRARERLHLFGHTTAAAGGGEPRPPHGTSLLAVLWPVLRHDFETARARSGARVEDSDMRAPPARFRRLPAAWRRPPPGPPAQAGPGHPDLRDYSGIDYIWAGETIRHVGSVVHRGIREMAEDGPAHWSADRIDRQVPRYRWLLAGLGVPAAELDRAAAQVREALAAFFSDRRGRWILDATHVEARNEYAVSGLHRGALVSAVIDRTFVDAGGTRWIIDYKTSRHEGADRDGFLDRERERYAPQLERYAALLSRLDGRPVRLGLYFPLLGGWREWAWD